MIQPGETLPESILSESTEFGEACPMSPKKVSTTEAARGKKIVIFGLPGAFTPTCSAKHVPGYLAGYDDLRAKGVDEIWCVSVNDGFVMAAWGRDQKALGPDIPAGQQKIRFLGDGSGDFARKLDLGVDIPGMGYRLKRFSAFVDDGVVKSVNVEAPGKFEVSDAATMMSQLSK